MKYSDKPYKKTEPFARSYAPIRTDDRKYPYTNLTH